MTLHLGDVPANSTLYIPFTSYGKTNGESITLTGLAVTDIEIYKNGSTTQRSSDAGYALLDTDGIDLDGITGLHGFSIDLSNNTDASFYAVGSFYWVVVSTVTVDSQTVTFVAATFRIVAAEAIAGKPKVDVDALLGTAWLTPATAGTPDVNVKTFTASAITAAAIAADAITAAKIAADAIGASEVAADVVTEIANAILAQFGLSGSAASAGATLASSDVDVFNQALDLLKEAPITAFTDGTPEANWGLRNYVTSRNAELREHPWKFAIKRRTLYPTDFVLDGITATLTGAWAPFRLTQKWMGDFITLRRSSDDTTDDFGLATTTAANGSVSVDNEIALDTAAVSTFIGSGSGYFSQVYDQSGNGNHLAQATSGKQPLYVTDIGDNDRVVASFDGSNDILSTSVAVSSLMSVSTGYMVIAGLIDTLTLDSATKASNHLLMGDASSKLGLYARKGGTLYGLNDDGSVDAGTESAPLFVPFIAELRHDGGVVYIRVNGEFEDSATSGDTSSLAGALNIGDLAAGSQALDFKFFAALTFSTIPTLAERDRIVSRLMRYVAAPGYDDFGWTSRYPLPSDCARMLPVRESGEFEGRLIKHEVEQGYILTDKTGALPVRYIQNFSDASRFDPLFTEALAARLATKMAHWLTGKASMVEITSKAYNTAIEKARLADSLESTEERPEDADIIDQRYDALGVR